MTKVAESARHRTLDLGRPAGAAALSSPFQLFMMYLISARYKAGKANPMICLELQLRKSSSEAEATASVCSS